MTSIRFDQPVQAMSGAGVVQTINTPFEAYAFLSGRRIDRYDINAMMARRNCMAASEGLLKPEIAEASFVRYLERNGLIAPSVSMPAVELSLARGNQAAV